MEVMISYSDSGTGDGASFRCNVGRVSGRTVADAITAREDDRPALTVLSFIFNEGKGAFIMASEDGYFGQVFWTGFVHTDLVAEAS